MRRALLGLTALLAPFAILACGNGEGTTAGTGGTTSSTTATHSSSSTTSTTTGTGGATTGTGGASGACINAADEAAVQGHNVSADTQSCTLAHIGDQPGTEMCIAMMDGLSMACANCFAGEGQCGVTNCIAQCAGGDGAPCMMCLAMHCDSTFQTCSGINPNPPDAGGGGSGG